MEQSCQHGHNGQKLLHLAPVHKNFYQHKAVGSQYPLVYNGHTIYQQFVYYFSIPIWKKQCWLRVLRYSRTTYAFLAQNQVETSSRPYYDCPYGSTWSRFIFCLWGNRVSSINGSQKTFGHRLKKVHWHLRTISCLLTQLQNECFIVWRQCLSHQKVVSFNRQAAHDLSLDGIIFWPWWCWC